MASNQGILSVDGFTGVVGEPLFLAFFDTADNIAIGDKLYPLSRTFLKVQTMILDRHLYVSFSLDT